MNTRFYRELAAAAVRGYAERNGNTVVKDNELLMKPFYSLTDEEYEMLIKSAPEDIKLYRFKRTEDLLPRIRKVLGFLRSICFDSLLDIGSGRGAFLFPFMDEFPYISVCSADILDERVAQLGDIVRGGVERLEVKKADICDQPYENDSADVVTMLEVLEHIPNTEAAVRSAVNIARKYVIVTVPSKADDNPEHIHLFTRESLSEVFKRCGVTELSFDEVHGHLFMIAKK